MKDGPPARKIPIPPRPSPGPPGSSRASPAGKATAPPNARPAPLPCGAASPLSTVSGMVTPLGRSVHRSAHKGEGRSVYQRRASTLHACALLGRLAAVARCVRFLPAPDQAPDLVDGAGGVFVAAQVEMAQLGGESEQHAQLFKAEIGAGQMATPVARVGRL